MVPFSIYIHIPFCVHRCGYCDFTTYAGKQAFIPNYVNQLCREIDLVGKAQNPRLLVHTVYLGGGTPTILPILDHQRILGKIRETFQLSPETEISIEANPGTVSSNYLQALFQIGYNRISFGMQSANPFFLSFLERQHDPFDVIRSVKWSRQAGFKNINLDLIFGLPGQTLEDWKNSLEFAIRLDPEHLSLYSLTLEPLTPLYRWVNQGLVQAPDDDLAADMYEWALDRLGDGGFIQYEISNWAKKDSNGHLLACLHNLQYWRNQSYFGFGAGAHGYIQTNPESLNSPRTDLREDSKNPGIRTENVHGIEEYIQLMVEGNQKRFPISPSNKTITPIDLMDEMQETLMVGLRLTEEGVSRKVFKTRFKKSISDVFNNEINELIKKGLLEWGGEFSENLRLTQRGLLLGNQVFMEFVGKKRNYSG
jgi:oxygen-independent coproporphyrinogen III oxidase